MIGLDAAIHQPRVCSTFTTRSPVGPARLREVSAQIFRLIRSELGPIRYCSFLEFTTGKAATSGGLRRPHLHTLWKDVDADAAPVIAGIAGSVLERASGAWRQDVGEIRTPAGATMYVARHHQKEDQAPPAWWGSTRRVRPSKGYYSLPAAELRRMARAQLREVGLYKRIEAEVLRLNEAGIPDECLDRCIDARMDEELSQPPPRVIKVYGRGEDPLGS